ncbi:MAG: hypothetical protein Q4C47_04340, partial [Planctomycetia bacterium]|nr:hypothetical protein [Planctomycetia bacterium]
MKHLLEGVGLLVVLAGVVALVLLLTVDDQLCRQAESAFETLMPEYRVTIGSASRVEGRGLLFRDVRFYLRSEQPEGERNTHGEPDAQNEQNFPDATGNGHPGAGEKISGPGNAETGTGADVGTGVVGNTADLSILSRLTFRNRRLVHPVLEVEQLQLSCPTDWEYLLRKQLTISEIYLQRPVLRRRRLMDGRDSLVALLSAAKPKPESAEVLRMLGRIRIEQGTVENYDPTFRMSDPSSGELPAPLWTLTGLSADLVRDFTCSTGVSDVTAPSDPVAVPGPTTLSNSTTPSDPTVSSAADSRNASQVAPPGRSPLSDRWNVVVRSGADFLRSASVELQLDPIHGTASLRGELTSLQLTEKLFVACGVPTESRKRLSESLTGGCDLRVTATLPADGALDWKMEVDFQGFYRHPGYAQPFDRIDLSGSLTPREFHLDHLRTQWGGTELSCAGDAEVRPSMLRDLILTMVPAARTGAEILTHSNPVDSAGLSDQIAPPDPSGLSGLPGSSGPDAPAVSSGIPSIPERLVLPEAAVLSEVMTKAETTWETSDPEDGEFGRHSTVAVAADAETDVTAEATVMTPSVPEFFARLFPNGQFRFRTQQLTLHPELRVQLPEHQRSLWDEYAPEGTLDVDGVFDGKDGLWSPRLTAKFHELAFRHPKFPYRLQRGSGEATLTPSELSLNLTMFAETRPVRIEGKLTDPLAAPTGHLRITAQQVQIEDALIQAVPDPAGRTLRQMGLRGGFDLDVSVEIPGAGQPIQTQMSFSSKDLRLCYTKFPYEIDHMVVTITCQNRTWLIDASGYHGSQPITGRMRITPQADRRYQTVMWANGKNVVMDEALRSALPETPRQIWDDLSPRGSADVQVQMVCVSGGDTPPDLQITASNWSEETSLEPAIFRYRLEQVDGDFVYRNGNVTVRNFSAFHDGTQVSCDADIFLYADHSWSFVAKNLQVERLCFDQSLIQALPPSLRSMAWALRPTGVFLLRSGPEGVSFVQRPKDGDRTSWVARWDLFIDSQGNTLYSGVPLENVFGTVRLTGSATPEHHLTRGELQLDSLVVQGVQLSQVNGPFSLEDDRFCFGNAAVVSGDTVSMNGVTISVPGAFT